MRRLSLTSVILLFVFFSFGQIKTNNDSLRVDTSLIKVTLLGTGTPPPIMERFGPSILVQAGSETLVFDAGRGCLQRLRQLNISYDKLTAFFLTHLHSDHIVGFPDLWLTGWLVSRRATALPVYGPAGTKNMIENLQKAYVYDIHIRIEDDKVPEEGSKLLVSEIQQGVIYEKNGVKVIAFEVDHFPIKPAFGYRIEYKGRSVVLSGDTKYSKNLVKYATGTDLLIHEVIIFPDTVNKSDPRTSRIAHHTSPAQAAMVFNEVKPKLAVYSHFANPFRLNDQVLIKQTKENYSGPFLLGEDLMSFSITDTVSVTAWKKN